MDKPKTLKDLQIVMARADIDSGREEYISKEKVILMVKIHILMPSTCEKTKKELKEIFNITDKELENGLCS